MGKMKPSKENQIMPAPKDRRLAIVEEKIPRVICRCIAA